MQTQPFMMSPKMQHLRLSSFWFLFALLAGALFPAAVRAQGTPVALNASADAYVRDGSSYAAVNYGTVNPLVVKKQSGTGYNRWLYIKFDLSGVTGAVGGGKLRLYGRNQTAGYSGTDTCYFVSNNTWTEGGITWNNKPALGAAQTSATVTGTNQYVEWDLSSLIKAQKAAGATSLSLAVTMDPANSTNGDVYNSREASSNQPQLVVYTAPPAPALSGQAGESQATLSWPAVSGATSYDLYRATTAGGEGSTPYMTNVPNPVTDTGLTDGTAYYYEVRANNAVGSSSLSNEVSVTPVPGAPVLTAAPGNGQVLLSWSHTVSATSYNLSRASSASGPFTIIAANYTNFNYTDTKVTNATTYYYQVSANVPYSGNFTSGTITATPTGTSVLNAIADSYVRDGSFATENYGTTTAVYVKKQGGTGYNRWVYLKFDLTGLGNNVTNARLRLYGNNLTPGYTGTDSCYFVADNTWTETGITWNNKPALGSLQSTATITDTPQYNEWDVSNLIKSRVAAGASSVTLAITMDNLPAGNNGDRFRSKESTTNPPKLVVSVYPLVNVNVNFQPTSSAVPSGYTADTGLPFDSSRGFGWVREDSVLASAHVPLDLSPNTRDRARSGIDPRLNTIIHMQYPTDASAYPSGTAVRTAGAWDLAVPNGNYNVTASVGDQPSGTQGYDSKHTINIQGVNAINQFVGSASKEFQQKTLPVTVSNGILTVDAIGGVNTKLNYVTITNQGISQLAQPTVTGTAPYNGQTGVFRDTAINVDLALPNNGAGVDPATIVSANVYLVRASDGASVPIPGTINTDAAGSSLNFQPNGQLDANTSYTFVVTEGLKDTAGASFVRYTATFTTGQSNRIGTNPAINFTHTVPFSGEAPAGLLFGPDGRLYATMLDGNLCRWTVGLDGSLSNPQTFTGLAGRALTGLVFDPNNANVLYVSNNAPFYPTPVPDFTGKITRLTLNSTDFSPVVQDYIVGLPRSAKDHLTNSLAFGPDGKLYVTQGSNSGFGAPDNAWYNRPERLLTAAVLQIDPTITTGLPINVQTEDYNGVSGSYNPYAANAPVKLYATGLRNPFDLVWHSNGHLYCPTNGGSAGGNTPASPAGVIPSVPAVISPPTEEDWLFDAVQGGYYGHPNPTRGQYVLNGGNPTSGIDRAEVVASGGHPGYPVGTQPDPNYRGYAWDFGRDRSPDGSIEYKSSTFNGALQHALLVCEYSAGDDVIAMNLDGNGKVTSTTLVYGDLQNPVDIAEDTRNGNLFVAELVNNGETGQISLLRPVAPMLSVTPSQLIFSGQQSAGQTAAQTVTVSNNGQSTLTVTGLALTGTSPDQFLITGQPTLPAPLAPGSSITVNVAFSPTVVGAVSAKLQITNNDSLTPVYNVRLGGLGLAPATGGGTGTQPPTLQSILDTYGLPITAGGVSGGGLAGDEVRIQRFQKANPGAVTVQVLGVFSKPDTASGLVTKFGYYTAGNASGKTQLLTVPAASAQTLNPVVTGSTSFDPATTAFGAYSVWPYFAGRTVYQEDALNTFPGALPHNVRVYPYKNADGSVQANAYLLAFEEDTTAPDFNGLLVAITNVKPATGRITLENLDGQPYADRLVFNRIGTLASPPGNTVHNAATLRVHNTGIDPLQITGLTITGPFTTTFSAAFPVTVAPGGTLDVPMQFTAESGRVSTGTLTIKSNVPDQSLVPVQLAGYWQSVSEGGQEPSLVEVVQQVFGYGTVIVRSGQKLANHGHVEAVGDEVLSPYWTVADSTQPVYVRQLSADHTYPNTATLFWYNQGAPSSPFTLFTFNGQEAQSVLPHLKTDTTQFAQGTFAPSGAFGFKIDAEWSDDTINSHKADLAGGGVEPAGHHVRFWPLRDRQGFLVPYTYLMSMDYGGINYDYQDNVYLITNMKPAAEDMAAYVNPFVGTAPGGLAAGGTYPGATVPFSMVQLSPDTTVPEAGGYSYASTFIRGFSHTHISGAGGPLEGNVSMLPTVGAITSTDPAQYGSSFNHNTEMAAPGYYKVLLTSSNVLAELTTSTRVGWHRYTFPQTTAANVIINIGQCIRGAKDAGITVVNGNTVEGYVTTTGLETTIDGVNPKPYTVYFSAQFDHTFTGYGTWNGSTITAGSAAATGANAGGYVTFDTTSGSPSVVAKVGISYVSIAGARLNLATEATDFNFDGAANAARAAWNGSLRTIEAQGRVQPDQRTVFYTALYHSLLHPNVASDVNGAYMGFDNASHVAQGYTQYTNFSMWDTYRTQAPLLGLIAPARQHDILLSLLSVYREGGWLPRWTLADEECNAIVGDPVLPIITDGYVKGLIDPANTETFYQAMLHNATQQPPVGNQFEGRLGLADYVSLGYVGYQAKPSSVNYKLKNAGTTSLEYYVADGALGLMAQSLGHTSDATMLLGRSRRYTTLIDAATKLIRPRLSDGSYITPFDPASQNGFKEGTAWQYTWMVPHDAKGLISAIGGTAAAESKLDALFSYSAVAADPTSISVNWSSGSNGSQYNPYNEPDLQAAYFYHYLGHPAKADTMLQAQQTLFTNTPTGVPGNDDLGTMSAWYVLTSLGIYPFMPGANFYTLSAPAFDHTIVHLASPYYSSPTLTIDAPRTPGGTQYVQGLAVGGQAWNQAWITQDQVKNGTALSYTLGSAPSMWATAASAVPPSPAGQ